MASAPHDYFFVALPSMAVIHLVPSCESSNFMVYEVGESTFMLKRPFMVMPFMCSSLVQVQVSPFTVPVES